MRRTCLATVSLLFAALTVAASYEYISWGWSATAALALLVTLYDVSQRKHTVLRNYPLIGHLRYLTDALRTEIQQYLIESDTSGRPVPRFYRSVAYERAKDELETVPLGSLLDFSSPDYRWVNHSCFPAKKVQGDIRITIGNGQCKHPYSASLLNISAMSYGSISKAAITALGNGAKMGHFYHNTGEGGLSPHHLATGADIVWQLGSAYFGARDKDGNFDPVSFRAKATLPQIKMIEIKISQGAKPGHGGILPGVKVDREIAEVRQVPVGKTVISPPGHTAFAGPVELCAFIQTLRDLSGGKPVGIKLCLGRREEFTRICEAMRTTSIYPDFITVDGGEGGSGAAPFDFVNFVGSPINDALHFVDGELKRHELREHIRVIASGKVLSAFNIFEKMALGADLCNAARGMMFALGCVQAYICNTNRCPTGITTNDPSLMAGLDVKDKSERVFNYHKKTKEAFVDLLAAAGLSTPREIGPNHISCRQNGKVVTLTELLQSTQ
jgi:glutamate synthase domain-containing protein 2